MFMDLWASFPEPSLKLFRCAVPVRCLDVMLRRRKRTDRVMEGSNQIIKGAIGTANDAWSSYESHYGRNCQNLTDVIA